MLLKVSYILVVVFFTSLVLKIQGRKASLAKPGCQEICGNVTIPYPYGIGTGCYLHKSFEVLCDGSSQDRAPLRFANNQEFSISEISMDLVRVVDESLITCDSSRTIYTRKNLHLGQHFSYSQDRNLYVAVGCNISATFCISAFWYRQAHCLSLCNDTTGIIESVTNCTGFNGCCQLNIPMDTTTYSFRIKRITTFYYPGLMCPRAFIAENSAPDKRGLQLPMSLNWVVSLSTCQRASKQGNYLCGKNTYCIDSTKVLGYKCQCIEGYKGNPYLPNGCQDTNDCHQTSHLCKDVCVNRQGSYKCMSPHSHNITVSVTIATIIGLSAFGAIGYRAYIQLDRIKKNKIKQKFFKKNGGHLLKKQLHANKSRVMKIKVYTAEEIENATKKFSRSRILGKGGQGTVYKALLCDKTAVAIKKSNIVDEDQVERFVNEVLILSQINHRNIVKLLGCCLEYEVPLLVYEYLSNGTLSQHLHDGEEVSKFLWQDRIRIAREVAGALAYLHSYASPSIFHRDIKPSNILLDENYKAVVSDFGLSRLVPFSRTHVTTQIEGTFGYLDPEYYQSGQLTAKSDIYAFGVVLIELLTRRKSTSSSDSGEGLISQFRYLMQHNSVFEILDKQVMQEACMDDLLLVTRLAKKCITKKGKSRPCMKEVVMVLDNLTVVQLELPHKCIIEPKGKLTDCSTHATNTSLVCGTEGK